MEDPPKIEDVSLPFRVARSGSLSRCDKNAGYLLKN